MKIIIVIFVVVTVMVAGVWLANWWGGVLFGMALWSLVLQLIGMRVANKAARRIDKKVRDIIINETV